MRKKLNENILAREGSAEETIPAGSDSAEPTEMRLPGDSVVLLLAVLFLTVPVIIFLWGWTRTWIAVCGTLLLLSLSWRIFTDLKGCVTVSVMKNGSFWLAALLLITIWCFFSGIGGFSAQTFDFCIRNATFSDLCRNSWPVRFEMKTELPMIQEMFRHAGTCSFVYYYSWWLPVAAVVKIFGFGMKTANVLLMLYTILEVFVIFYCLQNVLRRYSYPALFSMMLFGGWDYWMCVLKNRSFAFPNTADWWALYYSYSSNTTQLYNIFHACLPVWLIVCLILLLKNNRCKGAVGALCFAYNPFSTLAMVPLVLNAFFYPRETGRKEQLRQAVSFWNISAALFMLGVFSLFYLRILSNPRIERYEGIVFKVWPGGKMILYFTAFLLAEVLVYFFAMGWEAHRIPFYRLTLVLLCLIPIYRTGYYNDFTLKTPLPLLFLLMILLLKRYYSTEKKWRKALILFVLMMGFMTSIVEVNRNVKNTLEMARKDYVYQPFPSFAEVDIGLETETKLFASQYLAPDREEDLWFRYVEPKSGTR